MSQNIETKFKYNGAEYDFDVRDADDAEKFEAAINAMKEAELKDFFDGCLGAGAGVAICTDKSNISAHYAAYEHFLNYIKAQKDDILSAKNTFAKYSNRQQRRAAAKNNG